MNEKKILKAIRSYNDDPKDIDAQAVLRDAFSGYQVIVRDPAGKIDETATMEAFSFAIQTTEHIIEDCLTAEAMIAKPAMKIEADITDGRALRNGKTVSKPVVDWSGVSMARRRIGAYAQLMGQLPHRSEPRRGEMIAAELGAKQLKIPWTSIAAELASIDEQAKSGNRDARRTSENVDDLLYFRANQQPSAPAPLPEPPYPSPPPPTDVPAHCAATGSTSCPGLRGPCAGPIGRCGRAVLSRSTSPGQGVTTTTPDLFVVMERSDSALMEDLFTHMGRLPKLTTLDVPPGTYATEWITSKAAAAKVILCVLSPKMLNNEVFMEVLRTATRDGKRVVPYIARDCIWSETFLAPFKPLEDNQLKAYQGLKRVLELVAARG